eukprot:TRINITY_DN6575_c0_g1_i1.p1 TRINITY_DN6575_c0_g1~~TRINITY_DN6575_c0_g1_i1.p1  ORF type:complete len:648 (+),score=72.07 TRINITY_DN6575_c0_g1_i1:49-1992(+)
MARNEETDPLPHCDTDDADLNVRDKMTTRLEKGSYECCVCVETIKSFDPIWSCTSCYVCVHLTCLKQWAVSSEEKGAWRCPGCSTAQRTNHKKIEYTCFCGQTTNPVSSGHSTPHTCDRLCNKIRTGTPCPHKCTDTCHPGPCRPCHLLSETKKCFCGSQTYRTGCSEIDNGRECGSVCGKRLSCGLHFCKQNCHPGDCQPCLIAFEQTCFCGRTALTALPCKAAPKNQPDKELTEEQLTNQSYYKQATYSCGEICGKKLGCGNHTCKLPCHFGDCGECDLLPEKVTHCGCGKTDLTKIPSARVRSSCTDLIPTCSLPCGKVLECAHKCTSKCHSGDCPECQQQILLKCQCTSKSVLVTCSDSRKPSGTVIHPAVLAKKDDEEFSIFAGSKKGSKKKKSGGGTSAAPIKLPFTCQSRCQTTKICGKHVCLDTCCPSVGGIHVCEFKCGKKLSCGIHNCELRCHKGSCGPCLNSSFEELTCRCGHTMISPPVPCGTTPPRCAKPCSVSKDCGHSTKHNCHFGDCPPCTEMVFKNCLTHDTPCPWPVPCHMKEVTCGVHDCHKYLNCTRHVCRKPCHKGPCDPCDGICYNKLPCDHYCSAKCHSGECPACSEEVRLSCKCGYNLKDVPCHTTDQYELPLPCLPQCARGY